MDFDLIGVKIRLFPLILHVHLTTVHRVVITGGIIIYCFLFLSLSFSVLLSVCDICIKLTRVLNAIYVCSMLLLSCVRNNK